MWLISPNVKQAIERAYQSATVEQQLEYEARYGFSDGDPSRILTIAGDVAEIRIVGALTKAPSFIAMLFGGGNVTYAEIIAALAEADQNPEVKRLEMRADSPGGHIDGLFDAVAALQAFSKPITAVIENTAASAMYALVSQADEIIAVNRAVRVGSIGVVVDIEPSEAISVTNTQSPNKRPDVQTEEGRAIIREQLDALYDIFVDAIATGRGTTIEVINAEYGQGAVLVADEALKRGMIDSIRGTPNLRVVQSKQHEPETGNMNLNELKAQHADVYAAAVAEVLTQERDRVSAHLTMGKASGDMDTAIAAIKDGSKMTEALQATYLAAGMNRKDQQNRQDDDATVASAVDGANGNSGEADLADTVVSLVESMVGLAE